MPKHAISPEAIADLLTICQYIAENDIDAAESAASKFDKTFKILARMPRLGRIRPQLRHEMRSFAVGNYVVLCHALDDGVEIHRVIHDRRDIKTIVKKNKPKF